MAKGKSASSGKRVKKVLKENSSSITNGSIKRLARRGGVKRVAKPIYDAMRGVIRTFVDGVVRDATAFAEHRSAKTISLNDIAASLRRRGRAVYGF